MAAPGKQTIEHMHRLNTQAWRLAAKYGQRCRVLMERNKKLDRKLRLRSAKLGDARARIRELEEQVRGLQVDVSAERFSRRDASELYRVANMALSETQDELARVRRELEEKNNAAG